MSVQPNETPAPVDPLADFRLTVREAKVLFKRSRSGVPGLARVLAESLEEVLDRYDALVEEHDRMRRHLDVARELLNRRG